MVKTQYISYVSRSNLFSDNSRFFGFTPEKLSPFAQELFDLLEKWEMDGYVEIYEHNYERQWGRVKSSAFDGQGRHISEYTHLFHGRVRNDSLAATPEEKAALQDPLVVVTFQPNQENPSLNPVVVAEFIINHDQYIGRNGAGKGNDNLTRIRKGVRDRIDRAKGKFFPPE